jgi:DNA-binding FrmR family transcriptional regulator
MGARGYRATRQQLRNRLARLEGQLRGVRGMLEEDRPTLEILTQLAAVQGALDLVALGLVDQHAMHCLHGERDAPGEPRAQVDELMTAMGRLLRRSAGGGKAA